MTFDSIHMKRHHKDFVASLTPEELAVHNRPDVREAQGSMGKILKEKVKEAKKKKKVQG